MTKFRVTLACIAAVTLLTGCGKKSHDGAKEAAYEFKHLYFNAERCHDEEAQNQSPLNCESHEVNIDDSGQSQMFGTLCGAHGVCKLDLKPDEIAQLNQWIAALDMPAIARKTLACPKAENAPHAHIVLIDQEHTYDIQHQSPCGYTQENTRLVEFESRMTSWLESRRRYTTDSKIADRSACETIDAQALIEQEKIDNAAISVSVEINATGQVESTRLKHSSGSPALDAMATEAARRCTYQPYLVDGKPEPTSFIELNYVQHIHVLLLQ